MKSSELKLRHTNQRFKDMFQHLTHAIISIIYKPLALIYDTINSLAVTAIFWKDNTKSQNITYHNMCACTSVKQVAYKKQKLLTML